MRTEAITIEEARAASADFLVQCCQGVAKILEDPGKGFSYSAYVTAYDHINQCGVVCDIEGWMPVVRPDIAAWYLVPELDKWVIVVPDPSPGIRPRFMPSNVGLPFSDALWMALCNPGQQHKLHAKGLFNDSTFNQVREVWLDVATRIRAGELDNWLTIKTAVND